MQWTKRDLKPTWCGINNIFSKHSQDQLCIQRLWLRKYILNSFWLSTYRQYSQIGNKCFQPRPQNKFTLCSGFFVCVRFWKAVKLCKTPSNIHGNDAYLRHEYRNSLILIQTAVYLKREVRNQKCTSLWNFRTALVFERLWMTLLPFHFS